MPGLRTIRDVAWRFMGSYKWSNKSPNMVRLTTHEPPSIGGVVQARTQKYMVRPENCPKNKGFRVKGF